MLISYMMPGMRLTYVLAFVLVPLAIAQTPAWQTPFSEQRWADAEPLLLRAVAESPTAPALEALAQLYRSTGRLERADPVLQQLIAIAETAPNVEALARVKIALGQLDQAEQLLNRALELRLDADPSPMASISARRQLIQVLSAEKKFDLAVAQAMTAISIRIRGVGPDHPDLAGDYGVLARVYQGQNAWQAAATAWQVMSRIQAAAFGTEDLRVADTLENMAGCYAQMQKVPEAEAAFRRVLSIRQLNLGASHTDVAQTTDELGQLLYSAARFAEAEDFFETSLAIYMKALGPDNALLARNYDNLAVTEAALHKWVEAAAHYGAALHIRDADSALNLRHLALVNVARNDNATAEPLYRRALEVLDFPGNQNPALSKSVLEEYAALLKDMNRTADAAAIQARIDGTAIPKTTAVPVQRTKRTPVNAKQK